MQHPPAGLGTFEYKGFMQFAALMAASGITGLLLTEFEISGPQ